jgi:geranylgeranyl diphosphate synthase type II
MNLPSFFEEDRQFVEQALESLLPPESTPPTTIHRAMRYSVFAGGKRVRPILCLEAACVFSASRDSGLRAARDSACAVELIHTYSLIHDDLPALDNDDMRRGKPTAHKQFGEAMAILAGDALLTLAFQSIARSALAPAQVVAVLQEITAAAGTLDGMVGGQVADLEAEGRPIEPSMLEYIHRSKTAALIRASVVTGAICGGAAQADRERIRRFGENIGWAFQVVDDILDVEESSESLGKTAGKDQHQKKATYPALFGMETSRKKAAELAEAAVAELRPFGDRAQALGQLAEFLIARRS